MTHAHRSYIGPPHNPGVLLRGQLPIVEYTLVKRLTLSGTGYITLPVFLNALGAARLCENVPMLRGVGGLLVKLLPARSGAAGLGIGSTLLVT